MATSIDITHLKSYNILYWLQEYWQLFIVFYDSSTFFSVGWADDKGWTHLNFLGSAMAISMGGTRGIIRGTG